jgi:hypothetical protein
VNPARMWRAQPRSADADGQAMRRYSWLVEKLSLGERRHDARVAADECASDGHGSEIGAHRHCDLQLEEVRSTDNGVAHKGLAFCHGTTVDGRAGERGSNSLRPALNSATETGHGTI